MFRLRAERSHCVSKESKMSPRTFDDELEGGRGRL